MIDGYICAVPQKLLNSFKLLRYLSIYGSHLPDGMSNIIKLGKICITVPGFRKQ